MKRIICNILGLTAIASVTILNQGCDNFERTVVAPKIDITEEVEIDALADRQNLFLTSSYPWFAEANDSWITLHKYRGQALLRDSIVFEVAHNPSLDSRTGTIDIRLMDQMTKRITIIQNGMGEYITLTNNMLLFNKNKAEYTIAVNTRVEWSLDKTSENGFSFSPVDKNNLKIAVERNETGGDRQAKVTLISKKDPEKKATLTVIQKDVESLISISLSDDQKKAIVKKTGEELSFPIGVDSRYNCTVSDSWIKILSAPEMKGSTIVENFNIDFSVEPNTTGEERTGWVKIEDAAHPECCDYFYIYQRGVSRIIYCKPGGTGDGSSWEYAMGDFAKAMAACDNLGDMEIWVAEGEYQLSGAFTKKTVNAYGGFKKMANSGAIKAMDAENYVKFQYELAKVRDNVSTNYAPYFGSFEDIDLYSGLAVNDWVDMVFGNTGSNWNVDFAVSGHSDNVNWTLGYAHLGDNAIMIRSN